MTRVLVLVLLLFLLPGPILFFVAAKDRHHDEVLRATPDGEECDNQPCKIDFDGDGTAGLLWLDPTSPAEYYDSWLVAVENGREILRLPHRRIDNTLRTHVGIRSEDGRIRLVVYDRMRVPGPPVGTVFTWDGQRLAETTPTSSDREVLNAMNARDDAGTFTIWVLYRTFRVPILTVYYGVLGIFAWWIFRREKRRRTHAV